jgi:hypothetical protein
MLEGWFGLRHEIGDDEIQRSGHHEADADLTLNDYSMSSPFTVREDLLDLVKASIVSFGFSP